jgi:hypothetical protein
MSPRTDISAAERAEPLWPHFLRRFVPSRLIVAEPANEVAPLILPHRARCQYPLGPKRYGEAWSRF